MFLVVTIFWMGLSAEKWTDRPEEVHSNVRLHRGKRYRNKQSCEDIVTAIVFWSVFSSHVSV